MFRPLALFAILAILFTGCEGPMGPQGPQGETGPQGPAGRPHHFTTTVNANGVAQVTLPPEAGTLATPPGLTCYLQQPGTSAWLVIALDLDGLACGIIQQGGSLIAIIVDAPPGWAAMFTVIY
jgi:hypothetical protein